MSFEPLDQWAKSFNAYPGCSGEIRHIQDVANTEFQKYDIVHINLAGVSTETIPTVKELIKNSSTKLIVNLDYAVQDFQDPWKLNCAEFLKAIRSADFLFAQEPFQRSLLQMLWTHLCDRKEKIPLIPHPTDTTNLKKFYVDPDKRMDRVAVMYHRYDKHLIIPSVIARGGKMRTKGKFADVKVEVPTVLYGFMERLVDLSIFDFIAARKDWDKYIYDLSHCTVAVSYYTIHSQDRFLCETACLGIPSVATTCSHFGRVLFPHTTFSPLQIEEMIKAVRGLKEDEGFWNFVRTYAWNKVEKFGDKPSVERLLDAMRSWGIEFK